MLIDRIRGLLERLTAKGLVVRLECGASLEVMLTVADRDYFQSLLPGTPVDLYTMFYLEGGPGGRLLRPVLIGFRSEADRSIFRLLVTVQGMGVSRALEAVSTPLAMIAEAVEQENISFLAGLKGVGLRTAQRLVSELRGKMTGLVAEHPGVSRASGEAERLAMEVLKQLGYSATEAGKMLSRLPGRIKAGASPEELVRAALAEQGGP